MKTGNLYIPKTYFTNNGYRSLLKHDSPLGGPWLCNKYFISESFAVDLNLFLECGGHCQLFDFYQFRFHILFYAIFYHDDKFLFCCHRMMMEGSQHMNLHDLTLG